MGLFSKGDGGDSGLAWLARMTELQDYERKAAGAYGKMGDFWRGVEGRIGSSDAFNPIQYNPFTSTTPYGTGFYDPNTGQFRTELNPLFGGRLNDLSQVSADLLRRGSGDPRALQQQLFQDQMAYMDPYFKDQYDQFLADEQAKGRTGITTFDTASGYATPVTNMERLQNAQFRDRMQMFAQMGDRAHQYQGDWLNQSTGLFDQARGIAGDATSALYDTARGGFADSASVLQSNKQLALQKFLAELQASGSGAEADFAAVMDPARTRLSGANQAIGSWENSSAARNAPGMFDKILSTGLTALATYFAGPMGGMLANAAMSKMGGGGGGGVTSYFKGIG